MKQAIYAGTFDPITLGHTDLIGRAARMFDRLILAVAEQSRKQTLFSLAERMDMAILATRSLPGVEVCSFSGLLVEYARQLEMHVLVRGLRAFSDFEYEFQMALTNRKLAPEIETVFLMPTETFSYLNSSSVREILECEGDLRGFVPEPVRARLAQMDLKERFRVLRKASLRTALGGGAMPAIDMNATPTPSRETRS